MFISIMAISITIIAYNIGWYIFKKFKIRWLHPIISAMIIVMIVLKSSDTSYISYSKGTSLITYFIKPAVIALAFPLYKNFDTLMNNWKVIFMSSFIGTVTAFLSTIMISRFYMFPIHIFRSTLSKSITSALGIVLTVQIDGDPGIAMALTMLTSIVGFYLAPPILRWLRLDNPISMGLALGVTANVAGASKAVEIGETESAMSAISIPVTGIFTVVLIPIFLQL